MEKLEERFNVEDFRILALDESEFNHCVDNIHFNTIGSLCELRLDSVLDKKLCERLGVNDVYVESDFLYTVANGEVDSMKMIFGIWKVVSTNLLEGDDRDIYLEALSDVLKEVFETDDVSLETKDGVFVAYWVISDKSRMLWFIDRLNDLGIGTKNTFNVVKV